MRRAYITADLSYGDSGKGKTIASLVKSWGSPARVSREGKIDRWVVRYNGGPQAAHNVVDGSLHHTFAHFGSGAMYGAYTYLSRFMLINPLNMMREAEALKRMGFNPWPQTFVDVNCRVITPVQRAANRLRELARGADRHGSTGQGVGETVMDSIDDPSIVLYAYDLASAGRKLGALAEYKRQQLIEEGVWEAAPKCEQTRLAKGCFDRAAIAATAEAYAGACEKLQLFNGEWLAHMMSDAVVFFEGSQGVLLDEWFGFHPYTTWSTTTMANADELLDELGGCDGPVERLGIVRSYTTRHGPGPFPSEAALPFHELHNKAGEWMGDFRVGHFDVVALRYALDVNGPVDGLVMTHVDRIRSRTTIPVVVGYEIDGKVVSRLPALTSPDLKFQEQLTQKLMRATPVLETVELNRFLSFVESCAEAPITMISFGAGTDAMASTRREAKVA